MSCKALHLGHNHSPGGTSSSFNGGSLGIFWVSSIVLLVNTVMRSSSNDHSLYDVLTCISSERLPDTCHSIKDCLPLYNNHSMHY